MRTLCQLPSPGLRRNTLSAAGPVVLARTTTSTSLPRATFRTPFTNPAASSCTRRGQGRSWRSIIRRAQVSAIRGWVATNPPTAAAAIAPAIAIAASRPRRKTSPGRTPSARAPAAATVRRMRSGSRPSCGSAASPTAVERVSPSDGCRRSIARASDRSGSGAASRPMSRVATSQMSRPAAAAMASPRAQTGGSRSQSRARVRAARPAAASRMIATDSTQIQPRARRRMPASSRRSGGLEAAVVREAVDMGGVIFRRVWRAVGRSIRARESRQPLPGWRR